MKSSGQPDSSSSFLNVDAKTFSPKSALSARPKETFVSKNAQNSDRRNQQLQSRHENKKVGLSGKDSNRHGRNGSHLLNFNYSSAQPLPKSSRGPCRNQKKQSSYKLASQSNFLYTRSAFLD